MSDDNFSVPLPNRREMLRLSGAGFGSLALAALLADKTIATQQADNPLTTRLPHFAAQGEAGDIPLHGRRPIPGGYVRSETPPYPRSR